MIKISNIKRDIKKQESTLLHDVCKELKIDANKVIDWSIEKKSIDARKKPQLFFVYTITLSLVEESGLLKQLQKRKLKYNVSPYSPIDYNFDGNGRCIQKFKEHPPVIVGSGPAGMFCAYELALRGCKPIVIERGKPVEDRKSDVDHFWDTGILNTESNVQFGEGGAGTFSDGKLNTSVSDPHGRGRRVLNTLVEFGAPQSILYDSKPHIGTDILIEIVRNMRQRIQELGGSYHFDSKFTSFKLEEGVLKGIYVNETTFIPTHSVVLAIGNSARDTFIDLHNSHIEMEAKSFAIGLRMEHPQEWINKAQYGEGYNESLPAATYKLTANLPNKRSVYSFCMCPGGYVVNASSSIGQLAVNGMSYHSRDGKNANSAIVVNVTQDDFGRESVLDGMRFQEELEKKSYTLANGNIPVQRLDDFIADKITEENGICTPQIKGAYSYANIREIFPPNLTAVFLDGIHSFGKKIKEFDSGEAILSAIETRTSSPVRITRGDTYQSNIKGVYPCGEGAGYAGGITSAAIDGIKVFEALLTNEC